MDVAKNATFVQNEIPSNAKSSSITEPPPPGNHPLQPPQTADHPDHQQHQIQHQQRNEISNKLVDFSKVRIFKIIVIGDSNVGKTCLTYRFCEGKFPEKSEATIGVDFREKTVTIGQDVLKLQIWDTAGQERFRRSMVQHYYRNAHAVVFVYDVTRMSTFENLTVWMDECLANGVNLDVPKIVIGNKCDAEKQIVLTSLAQRFADGRQMPLFETSAKDNSKADHVESIFLTLAHKLHSSKPMFLTSSSGDALKLKPPKENEAGYCWC
ncbi:hypothetical protein HELRODRAFT_77097 [Helobdella robusta]|uniref:Uncharacterized protein n=1 Tax=Helobdella robusta TaxID=6412 RepID=T1G2T1_HELRO|nr:hypothetical protein HELRODRAFT_77097 [Helobdella robusta]ESO06851.1 hypothetical protein HELRODRAFT_77097 [Helobdella robusta]